MYNTLRIRETSHSKFVVTHVPTLLYIQVCCFTILTKLLFYIIIYEVNNRGLTTKTKTKQGNTLRTTSALCVLLY